MIIKLTGSTLLIIRPYSAGLHSSGLQGYKLENPKNAAKLKIRIDKTAIIAHGMAFLPFLLAINPVSTPKKMIIRGNGDI